MGLFSWKRLGVGLYGTIVFSKAVPEVLNTKYRSEFKHRFSNRSCLNCAILNALHGCKEKRAHKARGMQLFRQIVKNDIFKILIIFKNNTKFTRAAC